MSLFEKWQNLPTMLFEQATSRGDAPFLWYKDRGTYQPVSWTEVADRVTRLARGLRDIGVEPGDRVVLVSENRPEWLIADFAIMSIGAVTVPAYTTNTVDDHLHILTNSGAKGAIVSTQRLGERVLPAAHTAPDAAFVIFMEDHAVQQDIGPDILAWDAVLARGGDLDDDIAAEAQGLARRAACCIIYTSGTGGAPKGVVLHHGAILANCAGAMELLAGLDIKDEVFLCFLPLSHAYEHTAGQCLPVFVGAQIYYAEGVETLTRNLVEARPTLMTAVPRLYEMMHGRITRDVLKQDNLKSKLFRKTVELGTRAYRDPKSLSLVDRLANALLDRLVRQKMRDRFGGRLKALVSGGAPLPEEIGIFFTALGLRLLQGYGQTEAAPVISVSPPEKVKLHTVGPPVPGVEVRIADDGEILVKGELVMLGYWHNEEATANTVKDGWLYTGDVGLIDEDGYIQITDRKKDIIVNSGGDNVSPQRVEGFLALEPEIAQAMVFGDKRPYLVALLVPDEENARQWAKSAGKPADLEELAEDPDFKRYLRAAVDRVNKDMATVEKVRRIIVTPEPFTIENEQMTPTMKVRRHKIVEVYGERLAALYD